MEPPKTPEEQTLLEQAIADMLEGKPSPPRKIGLMWNFDSGPSAEGAANMTRDELAAAAPNWLAIESFSAQTKRDMLAMWTESVMDAIGHDHLEPDAWEALYLRCTLHALDEGRYFAALRFAEMVLSEPAAHCAPQLRPRRPEPATLADLRDAMEQIRARPAKN